MVFINKTLSKPWKPGQRMGMDTVHDCGHQWTRPLELILNTNAIVSSYLECEHDYSTSFTFMNAVHVMFMLGGPARAPEWALANQNRAGSRGAAPEEKCGFTYESAWPLKAMICNSWDHDLGFGDPSGHGAWPYTHTKSDNELLTSLDLCFWCQPGRPCTRPNKPRN